MKQKISSFLFIFFINCLTVGIAGDNNNSHHEEILHSSNHNDEYSHGIVDGKIIMDHMTDDRIFEIFNPLILIPKFLLPKNWSIYPIEIETILEEHPEIRECAVFALSDSVWGELPAAAVVLQPGSKLSGQEIIDFSSDHLANFKRLRFAAVVGNLPKTAAGKIQRKVLTDRFRKNLEKDITQLI